MCIKYVTEGTDLLEISLMRRYLHFDLTLLVHLVTQTWLKAERWGLWYENYRKRSLAMSLCLSGNED